MNRKIYINHIFMMLIIWSITGFISPSEQNPNPAKSESADSEHKYIPSRAPLSVNTIILYTDNFNGANDTSSLKARGYKVWYRGGGPQGLYPTWFQGIPSTFTSYNGPAIGYVAANYLVVNGSNNIDSWLVLPYQPGGYAAGDSISFWARSPDGSIYADSITVSYSAAGDSIPEGSWVLVGKFKVSTGGWLNYGFAVPSASSHGRIAIRYKIIDGGSGNNSNYIGIDALNITRSAIGIIQLSSEIPNSYYLSQNYPNPFNPSTDFTFDIPKPGNVILAVYDVLGNEVAVIVNGFKKAGSYSVNFDASNLSSGIYFYRITSGDFSKTMKMSLIK